MSHKHQDGGPVCIHRTKAACDEAYADWQAALQVALAAVVVRKYSSVRGGLARFKHADDVFSQLVLVLAGEKSEIEGKAPFTRRIIAALAQYQEVH